MARHWLKWWTKPAHARLIFDSQKVMSEERRQVMPTTNNILEAFNRVSKLIQPTTHLPIFMAMQMQYYLIKQLEKMQRDILTGHKSPKRKRGKQGQKQGHTLISRNTKGAPEGKPKGPAKKKRKR